MTKLAFRLFMGNEGPEFLVRLVHLVCLWGSLVHKLCVLATFRNVAVLTEGSQGRS